MTRSGSLPPVAVTYSVLYVIRARLFANNKHRATAQQRSPPHGNYGAEPQIMAHGTMYHAWHPRWHTSVVRLKTRDMDLLYTVGPDRHRTIQEPSENMIMNMRSSAHAL